MIFDSLISVPFKMKLVFAVLVLGMTNPVMAERLGSEAIYVVDMQRVVTESAQGKTARANLEADAKKQREDFKAHEEQVKKLEADFKAQYSVLSASARETRQKELQAKVLELRQDVANKTKELARRNNALVEKIVNETQSVIKEISKKQGYRFVIERGQAFVVYADNQLDLTDEVIQLLDKRR